MTVRVVVCSVLALLLSGCLATRYVAQAGFGQLELWSAARPIDEVIRDPDTDERTRVLLQEVEYIKQYAREQGLKTKGNYEKFVELDRRGVVWFVTASRPLAFEPKIWRFPIVGGFPYLGWFKQKDALKFKASLEREGWEVYTRPVAAYSTGGWFRDPVLSTMLSRGDDAFQTLANVLFHELVHANVLVNDQSIFNESVASFIGDGITEQYLAARFGADSAELASFRELLVLSRERGERLELAYHELEKVYASDAPDADKRVSKRRIIDKLDAEVVFLRRPNNAYLMGYKTYNAGFEEFAKLHEACGGDWNRFLAAVGSLKSEDFQEEQQEDMAPALEGLIRAGC